jgi:hypothetical protein
MIVVPLFDDKDCVAMMTWTIMAVVTMILKLQQL